MDEEKSTTASTSYEGIQGITQFSGDDPTYTSSKWCQDIEDNADIFGWTAQQKLIVARRTLTGTAQLWLRTEKTFKTYEELKTAITKEFPDSINVKEMHEMMSARKKQRNETYYQYMLFMKELGKRAKIPDYVAIQYIVDGIIDHECNKAVLYGVTSYSVLKEKLQIYEKMKAKMKNNDQGRTKEKQVAVESAQARTQKRCYNCGEQNHVASACKNGIKCFGCNEYGHIRTQCKVNPMKAGGSGKYAVKMAAGGTGGNGGSSGGDGSWRSAMFGRQAEMNEQNRNDYRFSSGNTTDGCIDEVPNRKIAPEEKKSLTGDIDSVKMVNNTMLCENQPKNPVKDILICNLEYKSLIDSGSELNLISYTAFSAINGELLSESLSMFGLGHSKVESLGKVILDVTIDGKLYNEVVFHVIPSKAMPYDVILGQEFLCCVTMLMNEGVVSFVENWVGNIECFPGNMTVDLNHIQNAEIRDKAMQCVQQYEPKQTEEAPIQLKIVLKDDKPVSQRPRRLSLTEQRLVEEQIEEWLRKGIIQVSFSEYSSPLVLVKKKDGTIRVCVDYRMLNAKIVKDEFPLPVIDDIIDKLRGAKVFSVLDLKNGFFHMKVSEESIPYTSFVTHQGQYEFLRAPFGLSICPKMFMRYVTIIFRELIAQGVLMIFIDDIIVPAVDEWQGLEKLKQVLDIASRHGLQINWKKAKLLQREIEYLGHLVSDGEVRPSTEKVDAVIRYPEPKNIKQLHSFVGLTSYFRKYIEGYAMIAKPLTDLLRKDTEFTFKDEHKASFQTLKDKLASGPVLKIYDPSLKTEMHTDASSMALAAILMQYHPGSGLHPVHYMSRRTNEAQSKYSSYELEALAVIEGVKKFRHYLYGKHFKIVTDCQAFEMTLRKKDLTAKVARWVMLLSEYDFEIEHRAGSRMRHTDALSRIPTVAVVKTLKDSLKEAQEKDEGLKAIKDILEEKTYKDYWIENGILYKTTEKLLVVPRSMEKEIIQRVHSNGHFSKAKMKEILNKDYYIKDVDKKIEEFILGCIPCLLATRKEGKQEGFLNPIEKESIPFDTLHLDHIGPLTETKKQYNHILTVIDGFTKFVWLYPTKSTSTKEVLDKLKMHQQTFGNPGRIVTDRGTAFTSHEFELYCQEENICHVKITTGVPRGNGQVERVHRILIPLLTKLSIENPAVWYRHVSKVQRALNSTFQRGISTTPFELLMGTRMKNKEDLKIVKLLQEESLEEFNEQREKIRLQAKEQILKLQEENRKTYNRGRKQSTKYAEGDHVVIKRTQFGPGLKLKPKYLGPYKVVKCKRNDRYDVEKLDNSVEGPNKTSSSADHMKRWPDCRDEMLED